MSVMGKKKVMGFAGGFGIGWIWAEALRVVRRLRTKIKLRRLRRGLPPGAAELFQETAFVAESRASDRGRIASTVPISADPITTLLDVAEEKFPMVRHQFKHLVILETTLRMERSDPFAYIPDAVLAKAVEQAKVLESSVGKNSVDGLHLLMLKIRRYLMEGEQRRQAELPGGEVRWQPLAMPAPVPVPSRQGGPDSAPRTFQATDPSKSREFKATRPLTRQDEDAARW